MDQEYVARFRKAFDNASMADVARRLKIPHATVRNYYQGRLPAPEVLIKIANETSVSLNWLLTGKGDMWAVRRPPVSLGRFIEDSIAEMIDKRLGGVAGVQDIGDADAGSDFDVETAVLTHNEPHRVMSEWFAHEGREYPQDFGVAFFRGWASFSAEDKIAAVRDAKRVLDRSLGDE